MTRDYLRNITPDALTGVISAYEGIRGSVVLLNGPLGCRFFHAYAAGQSVVRASELRSTRGDANLRGAMSDELLRSQWFCGASQIPGTNLRYEDNVFGTREQLCNALNTIFSEETPSWLAVIQTPGTSLLGEDLEPDIAVAAKRAGIPWSFEEHPMLSKNLWMGFDDAVTGILRRMKLHATTKRPRTVNLIGMSLYQRYFEGDLEELKRLFALCDVEINCVICGNSTMEELARIPSAALNLVLYPERGLQTAHYLKDSLGMDFCCLETPPVGFESTERMLRELGKYLKIDPCNALDDCARARARAFYFLTRMTAAKGIPKDYTYAMEGTYSELIAYMSFLSGYLGMAPACLLPLCTESDCSRALFERTAAHYNAAKAINTDMADVRDALVLGSANTILALRLQSQDIVGIETSFPSMGYIDVIPKTHLGSRGALFLLEQVLNGMNLRDSE